jgi:hypothetical protein
VIRGLRAHLLALALAAIALAAVSHPDDAEAGTTTTMTGTTLTSAWDGSGNSPGAGIVGLYCEFCSDDPDVWPGGADYVFEVPVPANVPEEDRNGNPSTENCFTLTSTIMRCRTITSFTATGSPENEFMSVITAQGGPPVDASLSAGGGDDTILSSGYGARTLTGGGGRDDFSASQTNPG